MISGTAVLETTKLCLSLIDGDVATAYRTLPRKTVPAGVSPLAEAIGWLCRAQDASGDGGVARSYALAYHPYFKRKGWIASYPETTGYIIPTMFDYARITARGDLFERAVRMAEWECAVQMPSGAVMGGTVDQPPTPAVFNTGQVLFGWLRAWAETGQQKYLGAAVRAGDFLLSVQEADGAWRKSLSAYASSEMRSYTYNTRTAWGLLELAHATGRSEYRDAAVRNVDHALRHQRPNGWFPDNCLHDPAHPLLHTIAYSLRGILEIGLAENNEHFVVAVRRAADAILARVREDGSLPGRFDEHWRPSVRWSCLTGNSQMGTVWGRLYEATGNEGYLRALSAVNGFTRSVQWLQTGNPGLDGGISGSYPLHGRYGRFEVLNWAVKFFADALMMEAALVERAPAAGTAAGSSTRTP